MRHNPIIATCILLTVLLSCTREQLDTVRGESPCAIVASFASDGPETRAILLDNPGVRMTARWKGGDRIGIAGTSGSPIAFQVAEADIDADGKSAVFRSLNSVPSGNLISFYPWQEGATVSGGKIVMEFPSIQHFSKERGTPQPDPDVAVMAGTGSAEGGVSFYNVMSILKIGQIFDETTTITKLEFRDLSGKAVSGQLSIDPSSNYASEVSGNASVLTLDCGEGVEVQAGELGKFFFVVPARAYPSGIEISFITSDGRRIAKTAGTAAGITLGRGIVYPVGNIPNRDYVAGAGASKLASGTLLMTPELLRQCVVLETDKQYIRGFDGEYVTDQGTPVLVPYFEMIMPGNLGLKKGSYVVFEATDDLPGGGVFTVTEFDSPFADPDHCRVKLEMTVDFAKAFDKVEFGGSMFDDEGNLIEDQGLDIDMEGYVSEIRDAEGSPVPFSITPEGSIALSAETIEKALTRAIMSTEKTFTVPGIGLSYSGDWCSASLGATLNLNMKAACKIEDGELRFVHFTFHPTVDLSAEFSLSKEFSFDKEVPLFTLYCAPGIPVAPGVVLVPYLYVSAHIGMNAKISLKTSISYSYDMGRFGFSYQNGVGFSFRHFEAEPTETEVQPSLGAELSGRISAYAGIIAEPYISLYGLFGAGLKTDFKLTFSMVAKHTIIDENNVYYYSSIADRHLELTPSLSFTPRTASLGGLFSKTWENLQLEFEFDPIWKRYLYPKYEGYTVYDETGWPKVSGIDGRAISGELYRFARNGMYGLIDYNPQNYPSHMPFVVVECTGVNYAYRTVEDWPTLDSWTLVAEVIAPSRGNKLWNEIIGWPNGGGFQEIPEGPLVQRYELLKMPAKGGKVVSAEGKFGEGMFPGEGALRAVVFKVINDKSGKEFVTGVIPPFSYYYPSTPAGDIFNITRVFERYYSDGEWVSPKEQFDNYTYTWSNHEQPPIWPDDLPLPGW